MVSVATDYSRALHPAAGRSWGEKNEGSIVMPTASNWIRQAAAMPVARYVEYLTPAPYIEEIVTQPFQLDSEGYLTIPTGPGLGIELDRDALRRFAG